MSSQVYNSPILQAQNFIENNYPQDENFPDMKIYIQNYEEKLNNIQNENDTLKNNISNLEKEKLTLLTNLEQKDISLSELTQIIENLKRNENEDKNKIQELEEKNKELNYQIIQISQKNKSLNATLQTFFQSPNSNLQQNTVSQILQLKNKLDEVEISKQKIEFENRLLNDKINEIQNKFENEIKLKTDLKNREILGLQKTISSLNNNLNANMRKNSYEINKNNNNINNNPILIEQLTNLENKIKMLQDEIYNLQKEKKLLTSENVDLKFANEHKDKFIAELQNKISDIEEQFKIQINGIQMNTEENASKVKQSQNQVEQLLIEKDEILKQNQKFKNGVEYFNVTIKELNDIMNKKLKSFLNVINSYNLKLKENRSKINQLKQRIDEQNSEIQKLKKQNQMLKENKQKLIEGKLFKNNIPLRSPSLPSYKVNSSFANNSNYNTMSSNNNLMNNNTNLNTFQNIQPQINNQVNDDFVFNKNNNYNNFEINSNQHIRELISDSNIISNLDDPYSAFQQQSLLNFKNVLSRVDQELLKNKEIETNDDDD